MSIPNVNLNLSMIFRVLCGTVKDFILCISEISDGIADTEFNHMKQDLKYKLDTLLQLLQKEEFKITYQPNNVTIFLYGFKKKKKNCIVICFVVIFRKWTVIN